MSFANYVDSLRRGLRRQEVRRHPVRALRRRLQWRRYWQRPGAADIVLEDWWHGLRIALPNTNNASLLFYRGHSEPSLVWLLQALVAPGMTFMDIGAHIGEYTLIGTAMAGKGGRAVALEPLSPCVQAIRKNAEINSLANLSVYEGAVTDYTGRIAFASDPGRTAGWIAKDPKQAMFETACWTLGDFLDHVGCPRVDVLKLDASGKEIDVLKGGEEALASGRVPVILLKLYHPDVTRNRFGYDSHRTVAFLRQLGFTLKLAVDQDAFPIDVPEDIDAYFNPLVYGLVMIAHQRPS